MRCIFTGGGTLGHTNPAIAVAEKVREKHPDTDILFIMRAGGKENAAVSKRGFRIEEIPAVGLDRDKGVVDKARVGGITLRALLKCMSIVKRYKPDFIFGTGGYVSFAPLVAGLMKGVPTYVHESNTTPGLVTKIAVRLGAIPLVSTEETKKHFYSKKECQTVGTPLLSDFGRLTRKEARLRLGMDREKIFIVSFGGSGGSDVMNEVIMELMSERSKSRGNIIHLHATGEKYFDEAKRKYKNLSEGYGGQQIVPRISDMALHMSAADIVICRCGAATLAELSAVGRAAILIPSPNVTNNHQYENGKRLEEMRAAIMLEERDLTKDCLGEKIQLLAHSEALRRALEGKVLSQKNKASSELIANILTGGI